MHLDDSRTTRLRRYLDELLETHDPDRHLAQDPVGVVHRYDKPADRDVAGLVAATLAYGRVDKVIDAADRALAPLDPSPAETLRRRRDWRGALDNFNYRMSDENALADLYAAISTTLSTEGSLEDLYREGPTRDHPEAASQFVRRLRSRRLRDDLARGFRYLLPDPADGSACKRLHLYFRWMGRTSGPIDPGDWTAISPHQLRMPLDTHTSRLCRYIGLTDRKSVDGKAVEDVTDSLRQLDPEDPIRYDFALAHLGIADDCIHERSEQHCPGCPIEPICTL